MFPDDLPVKLTPENLVQIPLYIASVVPQQTLLWQAYPNGRVITLSDIPLEGVYPSLGIDRALALWGAGIKYKFPCLVVDGGTALTFTGADTNRTLVGGAILPGVGLQLQTLATNTAALPQVALGESLPKRWALNTSDAIIGGVIYTILAGVRDFVRDWLQQFPDSRVIFTGGDGQLLRDFLSINYQTNFDPHLIFWGMQAVL